jgi:nucleoside-diphosphate-sugar epimerase
VADVYLTGRRGFLGQAVEQALLAAGHAVNRTGHYTVFLHCGSPSPGGIGEMLQYPRIIESIAERDTGAVHQAIRDGASQIITPGSYCSYDPFSSINGPYGVAKRFTHALLEATWRQHRIPYTFLELPNLYGPGDRSHHVIPDTIRKILVAKETGGPVVMWGYPDTTRGFMHVDDAAAALVAAIGETTPRAGLLGPVATCPIGSLVQYLAQRLGYTGQIQWDYNGPSVVRGWRESEFQVPAWIFPDGLTQTTDWWQANPEPVEVRP